MDDMRARIDCYYCISYPSRWWRLMNNLDLWFLSELDIIETCVVPTANKAQKTVRFPSSVRPTPLGIDWFIMECKWVCRSVLQIAEVLKRWQESSEVRREAHVQMAGVRKSALEMAEVHKRRQECSRVHWRWLRSTSDGRGWQKSTGDSSRWQDCVGGRNIIIKFPLFLLLAIRCWQIFGVEVNRWSLSTMWHMLAALLPKLPIVTKDGAKKVWLPFKKS